jgi:hypothetical protein
MKNYDVCIIGGGIAGLTAAYELSSYLKVCVIERENIIGGVARSWKNKDNVFVEHSWRGFPIVYKNIRQIMKEIPYNDTNCLSNLTYNNIVFPGKYIHNNKKTNFLNFDLAVIIFFCFIHIISRGAYENNLKLIDCLSKDMYNKIGYCGIGLDPNISSITDFTKSMFLLLYNHFQEGEKINVKNGIITSYYVNNYEYKNIVWNIIPTDGDYIIIRKNNSRYYINENIYFDIDIRKVEFQGLTKSTYEGLFKSWKTFLENKNVDFYLNTEILLVTKNNQNNFCLLSKDNEICCKNLIMANGFQSIDKLLNINIVSKELYKQLNLSISTTIIATTCSELNESYDLLLDSPVIFSYQILNKVFVDSNEVNKVNCKVLFNTHCLINGSYSLTIHNKKIYELTLDEFKNEMIFNLKILCDKNKIQIKNIDYIAVSEEIVFDGVKAYRKKDAGYFITNTSKNLLKPYYEEIPNIYFAGHDVYNSINIRTMESACESGKTAAKNILKNENIQNNIVIYKMENIENIFFTISQNLFLFLLLLLILFIISIKYLFVYKQYSKKICIISIFILFSYFLVCFYQLISLCYEYNCFMYG